MPRRSGWPAIPAERIDLLVTDMVMPGMLGNEVVDRVRAVRPGLPALFITGYAQQVLDFHGIPAPDLDIVQKPFTEAVLLRRVRRALDGATVPGQARPSDHGHPRASGIGGGITRTTSRSRSCSRRRPQPGRCGAPGSGG